jgi:hypothetical protein
MVHAIAGMSNEARREGGRAVVTSEELAPRTQHFLAGRLAGWLVGFPLGYTRIDIWPYVQSKEPRGPWAGIVCNPHILDIP